MKKRKLSILVLVFALIFTLSACKGNTSNKEGKSDGPKEKVLKIGASYIYTSFDPHKDWNGWEVSKLGLGETLFDLDNDYKLTPKLAKGYENIDPNTWEIALKDGIKFSNGEDVTAEKVIKSLERTIELNTEAANLKGATFEADGNKIIMKTEDVNATAINDLVDPHFTIIDVDGTEDFDNKPICTGPYIIDKFEPEKTVELVKNENYYDGVAKLDRIIEKLVDKSTTFGLALQSFDIDAAQVDIDVYEQLKDDVEFQVMRTPSSRVYLIYANKEKIPNEKVREGLFASIDRREIAEDLLKNGIEVTSSPFSEKLPFGLKNDEVQGFDLDLSKKDLEEASQDAQKKIVLKFYDRLNIPKIATQLQDQFTKAGYQVEANQHENSKYVNTGDFDLGMYGMVTLRIGDPYEYLRSVFGTEGTSNYNHYSNEEVDKLLKEMKSEFDQDKRNELSREILKIALADNMHYYIGNVNIDIASRKNVKNLSSTPFEYKMITKDTDIE